MIKIKNGDRILVVTKGAYKNYYHGLGYEPVEAPEEHENLEQDNTHAHDDLHAPEGSSPEALEEDVPEDFYDEEETPLSEIPLSEMKLSQLIAYAEQLGLEHDGTPNKKELRKLIRDHLT